MLISGKSHRLCSSVQLTAPRDEMISRQRESERERAPDRKRGGTKEFQEEKKALQRKSKRKRE